jgi:hypothetical protein
VFSAIHRELSRYWQAAATAKARQEVDMHFTKHGRMRRVLVVGLPGVAALLLAACGGSSSGATHTASHTTTPPAPATTPATTPAAPTTTTTPAATHPTTTPTVPAATTTPAGAGTPPCRAADLALSYLGGLGATGHGELGFALRNTGDQACTTIGFPGVQFLDRAGGALPTIATRTTQDFVGSVPKTLLTLEPGATASFRLGVTHGAASTVGCTMAYGLQVIPPNDTVSLRTAIPNGAYECRTATVSPLAKGTSAFA